MSIFAACEMGPVDPILGTATAFRSDSHPKKVNLGVGAYRDENGKPLVFKIVKKIEQALANDPTQDKEYAPIEGLAGVLKEPCLKLLFGPLDAEMRNRVASVQTLSGTGALRVGAEFISLHLKPPAVYVSSPTWETHRSIFKKAGIEVQEYPYWSPETKAIDFANLIACLNSAPTGSVILLHGCAHNPTGMDPSEAQWVEIVRVIQKQKLIAFVDNAYQGYASGDLEKDALLQRLLLSTGCEFFVSQSFAKNLGMYGERIGMLHVVCDGQDTADRVLSQLKLVIRPMYSSPPIHGAKLVVGVLGDAGNFKEWSQELKAVAGRIHRMRAKLRAGLEERTGKEWQHITEQIGMFSFTGLSVAQCERLIDKWHIYLLKNGRISMAGLNEANLDYVVEAFDEVTRAV